MHPEPSSHPRHTPVVLALEGLCFAGKTTLAQALATHRRAVAIPEYADLAELPPWPPRHREDVVAHCVTSGPVLAIELGLVLRQDRFPDLSRRGVVGGDLVLLQEQVGGLALQQHRTRFHPDGTMSTPNSGAVRSYRVGAPELDYTIALDLACHQYRGLRLLVRGNGKISPDDLRMSYDSCYYRRDE